MSTTVIYTRRSSGSEDDSTSLETQEADSCTLAEQLALTVTKVYREGVKSGATISGRPVMQQLLADIEAGHVEHVIAFKWSRMSRDGLEGMEILSRSKRHRVPWRFVHGDMPLSVNNTPAAIMFHASQGMGAEGEGTSIQIQTDRGLEQRTNRGGRRSSPKPPYGWESVSLGPEPDRKRRPGWTLQQVKEQAEVVEEMYHRLVGGKSLSSVTRWLQSSDFLTPTGKPPHCWSSMSVKNISKNPVNYGRVVTDRYVDSKEKPENEWRDIHNAEPLVPIVDEGTWRTAPARLFENRKKFGCKKSPDNKGLLSYGIAVCACTHHHPLGLQWRGDNGGRYKVDQKNHDRHGCPHISISSRPLDEKVWQKILKVIRTPDAIAEELESHVSGDSAKDELKHATDHVKKLEKKAVNLFLSLEDAESAENRRDILARRAEITAERDQAELTRQSIAARAAKASAWRESFDQLVAEIYARAAEIDSYDLDQKRATLQKLQAKVYISPSGGEDRARVEIGVSPPPPDPNELYDGAGLGGWDDINPANDWDKVSDEDLVRLGYYPEDNDEWPEELDKNRRSSHTQRDERVPAGGTDSKRSLT